MPTNDGIGRVDGNVAIAKPSTADLQDVLRRVSGGDTAKVIQTLLDRGDIGALTALGASHGASDGLKELVDLLIGSPLRATPRDRAHQDVARVIDRLQNDIEIGRREGSSRGFVARFDSVYLSDDQKTLTLVPKGHRRDSGGLEAMMTTSTEGGVFTYELQGRYEFKWAGVETHSLRDLIMNGPVEDKNGALRTLLQRASPGFTADQFLDFKTSVLALETNDPRDPVIYLAAIPRKEGNTGVEMAVICKGCKCDRIDPETGAFIGGPGGLEKPVVYFYPQQRASLDVTVEVRGKFTAQYPKPVEGNNIWRFIAETDGTIFDPRSQRRHSYLYWEADPSFPLSIDPRQAHCVPRADAQAFLERLADAFAFNDRETSDFVSYWVGRLERHPYCLVQVLAADEYERYAQMTIVPTPDTVNRLFMVIRGLAEPVPTGAPAFPAATRSGFTVVEWGGAELAR